MQAEVWQNFLTAYQRTPTSWTYQIIRYPHFKGALFHSVKKKRISPISQIRIVHTQITSLEELKSNEDVYIHLKFLDASSNRIQTMGDLLSSSFLLEPIHLDLRNNDMTTVRANKIIYLVSRIIMPLSRKSLLESDLVTKGSAVDETKIPILCYFHFSSTWMFSVNYARRTDLQTI